MSETTKAKRMTPNYDPSMVSDRDGQTESGKFIPAGTKVDYICHTGWPIKVRLADGSEEIMNPHCFPLMRD